MIPPIGSCTQPERVVDLRTYEVQPETVALMLQASGMYLPRPVRRRHINFDDLKFRTGIPAIDAYHSDYYRPGEYFRDQA